MEGTILFLINSLRVGGAERVFVSQANECRRRGREIVFAVLASSAPGKNLQNELNPAIPFHNLEIQSPWRLGVSKKIQAIIREYGVTKIYSTLDYANIIARMAKFKNPSLRVVIRESGMASRKTWRGKIVDRFLNFFADGIIAVSREVGESLVR